SGPLQKMRSTMLKPATNLLPNTWLYSGKLGSALSMKRFFLGLMVFLRSITGIIGSFSYIMVSFTGLFNFNQLRHNDSRLQFKSYKNVGFLDKIACKSCT